MTDFVIVFAGLGATVIKALLERQGIASRCIGSGMGAALTVKR